MVLCNLADTYYHQGRLEEALTCVQAGLRLATETLEVPFLQVLAHETAGIIHLAGGDDEGAYQHLTVGLELAQSHDIQQWLVLIQIPLAEIHLKRGDLEEARRTVERALQEAVVQGLRTKEGVARRTLGRICQAQGLTAQAEAELLTSLELVAAGEGRYELARAQVALAELYAENGTKMREGLKMVQDAMAIFRELGADLDLRNAQVLRTRYETRSK
jgi:tetratricopeptide (TPR) repeat protein